MELALPLEDAGSGGGGFGARDVAGALEEDREARVDERVVGLVGDEAVDEGEGVVEAAGVFECAEQGVAGGVMVRIEVERALEERDGEGGFAGGHAVERVVEQEVGVGVCVGTHMASIERTGLRQGDETRVWPG